MTDPHSIAPSHAWSGRLPQLVEESTESLLHRLCIFIPDASEAQRRAWRDELGVLHSAIDQVQAYARDLNDERLL